MGSRCYEMCWKALICATGTVGGAAPARTGGAQAHGHAAATEKGMGSSNRNVRWG